MIDLLTNNVISKEGSVHTEADGALRLHGEGTVFGQKFYYEQARYSFEFNEDFTMDAYFVLEYACIGLRRQLTYHTPFVFGLTEEGREPFAYLDDISTDNRPHSLIVKGKPGRYCGIEIEFYIDRRMFADFTVYKMYSCSEKELPVCCEAIQTETAKPFKTISIEHLFNKEMQIGAENTIIDGGRAFEKENIFLCEVPFQIKTEGNNVILPPAPPAENEEMISNFGKKVKRGLVRPVSRDSLTEIPVHEKVSEIFFIMSMEGRRHCRWGFGTDGTVLGGCSISDDVLMPLLVTDTEGFAVEIVYANGNHDFALPMNLQLKRHGMGGDVSAYAVPADGSEVEKIIFHNRSLHTDFMLAAVTINNTDERLMPELLIPELPEKAQHVVEKGKSIKLAGNVLNIKNDAISMAIDISRGMHLLELRNDYTPIFSACGAPMLKLRKAEAEYVTEFELRSKRIDENKAVLTYAYHSLELCVEMILGEKNDIKWQLVIKNNSSETVKNAILFPCFSNMIFDGNEDGWYYVPKFQNIHSNETVFVYEESAPSFPMQFLDVYSASQQGGFVLTTRERGMLVRKYQFEKDDRGIGFYVEYPQMYGEILPGAEFCASPTVLTAHEGDWHQGYAVYKDWLDSWYEPYHCQDKQWYRENFCLLSEPTDFYETREMMSQPAWYNNDTKEFRFDEVLEEYKSVTGYYPDIVNLWGWTNSYKEDGSWYHPFGNYGTVDYDRYGGVERFKKGLYDAKDKLGVDISLYLHPTLLSDIYPQAKEFIPKELVINDIGDIIKLGNSYRLCHASQPWRDFMVDTYVRLYNELGIKILYVDEFSLRIENRCWNPGHGHSVPSNLLKTDCEFIKALKDRLPEEVVLYGEYAACDVYAKYIDCNISYYLVDAVVDMVETAWRADDGDDRLGRMYNNIYRFAFPKIVQLDLPWAMRNLSWHPRKFIFFNGEAIYDPLWDFEESAGVAFSVRAHEIKKQYADCFTSDHPEMLVETLSTAICANRFPGKGREVYTIYNRAYQTYRGNILRVPHRAGAKYVDVWNNRLIEVSVSEGYVEIPLEVHALQMGCVAIEY